MPVDRILALGAEDYDGGDPAVFNMAVMGFRLAQRANGVSQLHGDVSRGMFNGLWPAFDEAEVPITSITNGVHAPTWVGREVFDLAGPRASWCRRRRDRSWDDVDTVPGHDLWAASGRCGSWSPDVRGRLGPAWAKRGAARPSSAGSTGCSTPRCSPSASRAGSRRTSGSP